MPKKITNQEWVIKANLVHENQYSYEKTNYIAANQKVIITCLIHGDFEQRAAHHIDGHGCKKCGNIQTGNNLRKDLELFIEQSNLVHLNKYDYSKSIYKSSKDKIIITCPIHGDFSQIPDGHINGKQGCPICKLSKGEQIIYNWLSNNHIKFIREFRLEMSKITRKTNVIFIDFFVKHSDKQYFIEYDGEQHFKYIPYLHKGNEINFEMQVNRDQILKEFCDKHADKVTLVRFNYLQSSEQIQKQMDSLFRF